MGILAKIYVQRMQILRFGLVGAICALVEIILFRFFTQPQILPSMFSIENARTDYPISNFLSTGFAIVLNYFLSIKYVFEQGKYSKRREFVYFVVLSVLTLLVSWRIFALFSNHVIMSDFEVMGVGFNHLVVNKVIAIAITSLLNYGAKKRLVFDG